MGDVDADIAYFMACLEKQIVPVLEYEIVMVSDGDCHDNLEFFDSLRGCQPLYCDRVPEEIDYLTITREICGR